MERKSGRCRERVHCRAVCRQENEVLEFPSSRSHGGCRLRPRALPGTRWTIRTERKVVVTDSRERSVRKTGAASPFSLFCRKRMTSPRQNAQGGGEKPIAPRSGTPVIGRATVTKYLPFPVPFPLRITAGPPRADGEARRCAGSPVAVDQTEKEQAERVRGSGADPSGSPRGERRSSPAACPSSEQEIRRFRSRTVAGERAAGPGRREREPAPQCRRSAARGPGAVGERGLSPDGVAPPPRPGRLAAARGGTLPHAAVTGGGPVARWPRGDSGRRGRQGSTADRLALGDGLVR